MKNKKSKISDIKRQVKKQPKKQVKRQVKKQPKKQVKRQTKKQLKKQIKKQRVTKQTKKIQKLIKKFNEVDLRKIKNKDIKSYVLSLRKKYKEGEFQKKFTKYLWQGIQEYLKIYGSNEITRFINESKISRQTFNKIAGGQRVSNKTYKKFLNFVNQNFSQPELAFFWRITNLIKEGKGKVSAKRIRSLISELYEFLNYEIPEERLTIYDYLQVSYGH